MKWSAEAYIEQMTFKKFHKPFVAELFGPLIGLDREWKQQGASAEEIGMSAFGFDYVPVHHLPVNSGLLGGGYTILEDNDEIQISIDRYGRRMKLCKATATIPLPENYPLQNLSAWKKEFRDRYLWNGGVGRIGDGWLENAKQAREAGQLVKLSVPGAFDEIRQLLGEEEACLFCYEEPELLQDILEVMADCACHAIDEIAQSFIPDQVSVHEDMAGKSGPLWGPKQIEEFAAPYYKKIRDCMDKYGIPLFEMDSDGDMSPVLDQIVDSGINVIHPLEPVGNLDAVSVRKKYGHRLAFKGGIDKHKLRKGQKGIQEEIERVVRPLKDEMGVIFGLDHRIPNGTPLKDYRYYVQQMRAELGLTEMEPGWGRMAF